MTRSKYFFLGLCCSLIALVINVDASQSFRHRVSANPILSQSDIESDVKAEIEFGREVAARILGKYKLSKDYKLTRYITLVGRSLALNSNRPEIEFHFGLLETNDINAYSAPGGYVFLTRGSVNLMEDEDELAGVLAHEIAHVTEMHIVDELNIKGSDSSMSGGLARILGSVAETTRVAFDQVIDQAVALLFKEGLRKQDEFEADQVGTLIATNSGYDPNALYRYLQRVKLHKGKNTEIVNTTHPPFVDRLVALNNLLTEDGLVSSKNSIGKQRFQAMLKK